MEYNRTRISHSKSATAGTNAPLDLTPRAVSRTYRYRLGNLVFVAPTRHGAILLDLSRNRYLGVGRAEAQVLERVVEDWPAQRSDFPTLSEQIAEEGLIDLFVIRGIIQVGRNASRAIPQASISLDGELVAIGDEVDVAASVHIGYVALFLYALITSSMAMRFRPIASIMQRIHERRVAALQKGCEFEWRRASELVSIFRKIRPYAFAADGRCLLHALTLVRFLAHFDQFPMLVLGVKVDPWGAHSWVQHGNFLLDTNPEKVCAFTSILAV